MVIRLDNRTTSQCIHVPTHTYNCHPLNLCKLRKNTRLNHHKTYRSRWLQPIIIYSYPIFIYNIVFFLYITFFYKLIRLTVTDVVVFVSAARASIYYKNTNVLYLYRCRWGKLIFISPVLRIHEWNTHKK